MTRPVRGVVFDMGGILRPTPFEVLPAIARSRGLPEDALPAGPFGPAGDPDYEALDRGEIREAEYWERVQARMEAGGIRLEVHELIDWTGVDRPEVVGAIRRLSRRFRLALLTNDASEWLGPDWERHWDLKDCFAVVLDAATEGIRKPAEEIYLRTAERLGLRPEECLFVDDLEVNVEGARRAGMQGLKFDVTDPGGSVERLLAALGP